MSKLDIKSMTIEELTVEMLELGLQKFRAKQIYSWLQNSTKSFDEMTNLSKDLREKLDSRYEIRQARIGKKQVSQIDGTIKYLFRLNDNEFVESVLMKYKHGYSICISTQVGCKMKCDFCATGKGGFSRNLMASEMLSQIQTASEDIGERISNVVMMGMGEPLDNFESVVRFLELISSEDGMNIGMRHITLSTCGIVPKIYELAELAYPITLSVSLHAPNNAMRSKTMPVNNKWGIDELLEACKTYIDKTHRRISFEYAMISGENDSDGCAIELAQKLKGMLAHVNLIPVNDVTGTGYEKSGMERQKQFVAILEKAGVPATIRRTLGADIDASCGQLKRQYENTSDNKDLGREKNEN